MVKKLGERLVEAGLITRDAVEQALQHQKITGHKLGECLVEIGKLQETVLLRFLAGELNTRFVSAEKLSKAKISPSVLDKVPVRMAEAQHFLPIAIDDERGILSIVASEPQNEALLSEISLVTGVKEVYAFIGLRSAIQAAIRKHYYGDPTAFTALEAGAVPQQAIRSDLAAIASAYEAGSSGSQSRARVPGLRFETDVRIRVRSGGGTLVGPQPTVMREALGITRSSVGDNNFAEALNILVGMLELNRKDLRGHSSHVARLAVMVARRLGLAPREVSHVAIASHLHDLGKPADKHFTLASLSVNDEWKNEAKRYHRAPIKLFETVNLPPPVNTILGQLYEAYDGSGVPGGAKGDEIALGARILAAVDSYLDLIKNHANAVGRVFTRDEALAHLSANIGKLYDPAVVDLMARFHSGELLRQRVLTEGRQILVADSEEGVRTDLAGALGKLGLVASTLSTMDGAADAAVAGEADVVVVGLRFGLRDILGLVEVLRSQPATTSLPVVVLGQPQDASGKMALAQAGVVEVLPMPLQPEAAAQTIANLYNDRILNGAPARVVHGSLDEMSQGDLLALLGKAKKSGRLVLRSEGREGFYQFEQGKIVYANFNGEGGAAAARALFALRDADFSFDPDSLLLDMPQLDSDVEGMLRDLASAPLAQT